MAIFFNHLFKFIQLIIGKFSSKKICDEVRSEKDQLTIYLFDCFRNSYNELHTSMLNVATRRKPIKFASWINSSNSQNSMQLLTIDPHKVHGFALNLVVVDLLPPTNHDCNR